MKIANGLVTLLLRLGVPLGPLCLLVVPGRRSRVPRATPVMVLVFDDKRYLMQNFPGAGWVQNARAAGGGLLGRGHRMRRVAVVELPVEQRAAFLRRFGEVASGTQARRLVRSGLVASSNPQSFAAAAPTTAIFRVNDAA